MAVQLEIRSEVAYIRLATPPVNILSAGMMNEICGCLEEIGRNRDLKAVAFVSAAKAFSAGADVGEHHPDKAPAMIAGFSRMFKLLGGLELPVVMAVNGAALGAGFELCMLADVLVASEKATFGQPEIRLGFFAPLGVAYLAELVGPQRAMEITCTGATYSASQMKEMGLVSRVVPPDSLESELEKVLDDIRKASPVVLRLNVRLLKRLRGKPYEEGRVEAERVFLEELVKKEDVLEGIASFYEKRAPRWKNR